MSDSPVTVTHIPAHKHRRKHVIEREAAPRLWRSTEDDQYPGWRIEHTREKILALFLSS
ncbi:MAG: hypothetical protein ABI400_09805 [Lacisediminihabitans sp.]